MKILNVNSYYLSSTVHKQLQIALSTVRGIDSLTYVPLARGYIGREECQYKDDQRIVKAHCFNRWDRYIFHAKHTKIYRNAIETFDFADYTCLHAHSLFSNGYIALRIKESYGLPYVVAVRDTDINVFFKKMPCLRHLGKRILDGAAVVVFLSQPYRDHLLDNYIDGKDKDAFLAKSQIIPSGIDDFWFENKNDPKKQESTGVLRILHVGRVDKRKNVMTTLSALEEIRAQGKAVTYTVVGKVVDKKVYKEMRKRSFVNYLTPRSREELLEIYRGHDILVMPSLTETFGLVYPEAMSQGLPVIYSRGQGFDGHFVDGEIGYAVDSMDASDIADKILRIWSNYDEMSERCVELVDSFKWDNVVHRYKNVYESACE